MGEKREHSEGFIAPDELQEEPMSGGPPPSLPGASGERSTRKKDRRVGLLMDGRFLIRRLVARGGMGKIYEAEQQPLGRRVALKVMDLGYAEDLDPDFQKRFFLEASTCASLSHPNTIRVFDYGSTKEENGAETYYIVMEFIEGETLLNVIDQAAPLDPLRVIHIARQICGSLGEAHAQGVIHRDLKPSNVLLTQHGEQQDFAKVLDFGLVKLLAEDAEEMTKSGLFLGSPNYMSPEQIRSNRIDQRADLYSLGVILYMALTGKSPFKRNSSVNVLLAQLEDDPPPFSDFIEPGSIPNSLEWLVHVLLAKKPGDRFADVYELNRALKAVQAEIRGQVPMLDLELDREGRLLLPHAVDEAIQTVRWGPSGARLPTSPTVQKPTPRPADPIPSDGSLLSRRIRKDAVETGTHADRPRHRSRRRKRTTVERMLGSPLFAMFLGGLVVVLLASLVWVAGQFATNRTATGPQDDPIEEGGTATELLDLPMAEPEAVVEPTPVPAPVRTEAPLAEPVRTPVRRPPSERETVQATPAATAEPDATPAPEAESNETPAPTTKPRGGDLRDPWSD